MATAASPLDSLQAVLAFNRRKFHAWWEGFAFDDVAERAAILAQFPGANGASGRAANELIAESIWGDGRLEPGSPAWTMRFARLLSLPVRANVIIFGAGAGAPLADLKHGTRWKASGFTRNENFAHGELRSYDAALNQLHKASAAGALSFFELHKESDPLAFARFASELMLPGAKAVFVDFTVARKGARLRSCFPRSKDGAPRVRAEFQNALSEAGFTVSDIADETAAFLPLIAQGWAGWRRAYAGISNLENVKTRADLMHALAAHARLWAERFDALKSGQLQVTRFRTMRG